MSGLEIAPLVIQASGLGFQICKRLFKTIDELKHAPKRIKKFARKVSRLSKAIKHVSTTLESSRGSYNEDCVRSIKRIITSCHEKFKRIDRILHPKNPSSARLVNGVRWLMKKPEAAELLASIETETRALDLFMDSITLSATVNNSRKVDGKFEKQEELIKVLIAQNENTARMYQDILIKQQCVEKWTRSREIETHVRSSSNEPAYDPVENLWPGFQKDLRENRTSEGQKGPHNRHVTSSSNAALPLQHGKFEESTVLRGKRKPQPMRTTPATSAMLLQIIPWESPRSKGRTSNQRDSSTVSLQNFVGEEKVLDSTSVVRMMLDKYTPKGSTPLKGLLGAKDPKPPVAEEDPDQDEAISLLSEDVDDYDNNELDLSDDSSRLLEPAPRRNCWEPNYISEIATLDQEGKDFLKALRRKKGQITWMKGNNERVKCFAGNQEFYRFELAPSSPFDGGQDQFTRIGKGWVLEEFLDLHHYNYIDLGDGYFHIFGVLEYVKIKELVALSMGSLERSMIEHARNGKHQGGASNPIPKAFKHGYGYPNMPRYPNIPISPPFMSSAFKSHPSRKDSIRKYSDLDDDYLSGRHRPHRRTSHRPTRPLSSTRVPPESSTKRRETVNNGFQLPQPSARMTQHQQVSEYSSSDDIVESLPSDSGTMSDESTTASQKQQPSPSSNAHISSIARPSASYNRSKNNDPTSSRRDLRASGAIQKDLAEARQKLDALQNTYKRLRADNSNPERTNDILYHAIPDVKARIAELEKELGGLDSGKGREDLVDES